MYRLWRDVHLVLGLFLFAFVMLFGISSLSFSHHSWFDSDPALAESTVAVDPLQAATPRQLARQLMDREGLRGGLHDVRDEAGQLRFAIRRMGTTHDVQYARGSREARVETRVYPFPAMLTWMHGTFGLRHEYGPHNVWGVLMLVTSLGLLALGGSGLYLWFQRNKERRIGVVLLGANLVVGGILMALFWVG